MFETKRVHEVSYLFYVTIVQCNLCKFAAFTHKCRMKPVNYINKKVYFTIYTFGKTVEAWRQVFLDFFCFWIE